MKKIIAIIGIAVFSMVLFANTNNVSNNGDFDLASVAALNEASAECPVVPYWLNARCSYDQTVCWHIGINEPAADCSYGY